MAKKHSFTYPQILKKKALEDYTKVTPENRSVLVKMGRILYVIERGIVLCGHFNIRPKMTKGWITIKGDPVVDNFDCFSFEDEGEMEYRSSFKSILDWNILRGTLFVKNENKIVRHEAKSR